MGVYLRSVTNCYTVPITPTIRRSSVMSDQMQLQRIHHFPWVTNFAVTVFISLWFEFFQLQFPLVCCLLLLDDRRDRTIPIFPMDLGGATIGCICLSFLVHSCVHARLCILHARCFSPSFSFGSKQPVPCRRKPGCVWRLYNSYCSRWQERWGCTKFGSLLSPQSSIAVPTSSQPLRALMVCSTCPQHHVTIILSSHFFWHLEWKRRGGGKKRKSDGLGLQGQQRRLEISAVHMSTATTVVGPEQSVRESPCTPGLGGCLGRTRLEEWMLPLNQIPFRDNQTFPLM